MDSSSIRMLDYNPLIYWLFEINGAMRQKSLDLTVAHPHNLNCAVQQTCSK